MAVRKKTGPLSVIILSGSTGRTCQEVVKAALAQFPEPEVALIVKAGVRSAKAAAQVVESAAASRSVICHTIVAPRVRQAITRQAKRLQVPVVDVLGPVVSLLADHLRQVPRRRAGLSYQLHKEQFDRIEAVNFTLAHDDGCCVADLHKADVVLVGVSRCSKSVTCSYLAYRGIRAANVPLVPGCPLPPQLIEMDPHRVIGLVMNARRLQALRAARVRTMGRGVQGYDDFHEIQREIRYAQTLMARHGWRRIDVSYSSVEEVAKEVLELLQAT